MVQINSRGSSCPGNKQLGKLIVRFVIFYLMFFSWRVLRNIFETRTVHIVVATSHVAAPYVETEKKMMDGWKEGRQEVGEVEVIKKKVDIPATNNLAR